jgi:hypothetical protein
MFTFQTVVNTQHSYRLLHYSMFCGEVLEFQPLRIQAWMNNVLIKNKDSSTKNSFSFENSLQQLRELAMVSLGSPIAPKRRYHYSKVAVNGTTKW